MRVRDVTYVASQPWPFPSQLMIGCHSMADDDAMTIDTTETGRGPLVQPREVKAAMAGEPGARS